MENRWHDQCILRPHCKSVPREDSINPKTSKGNENEHAGVVDTDPNGSDNVAHADGVECKDKLIASFKKDSSKLNLHHDNWSPICDGGRNCFESDPCLKTDAKQDLYPEGCSQADLAASVRHPCQECGADAPHGSLFHGKEAASVSAPASSVTSSLCWMKSVQSLRCGMFREYQIIVVDTIREDASGPQLAIPLSAQTEAVKDDTPQPLVKHSLPYRRLLK